MKLSGIVADNGFIKITEPKTINGRDHFKIEDQGNLHHFPKGTQVQFSLNINPQTGVKVASIISRIEAPIQEAVVLDFVDEKLKKQQDIYPENSILHFYIVFNPMFNEKDDEELQGPTQAHSFYNLLKKRVTAKNDAFLYWGKLKSTDANVALSQDNFEKVVQKNAKMGKSTHLYISDFNNFWCAQVSGVEFQLDKATESQHTLNFYKQNWDRIEAWFKITDMKLLSNNSKETNKLISNLQIGTTNKLNSKQDPTGILKVTPYLSGLRYPLIIEDSREETYFNLNSEHKSITTENVLLEQTESKTQETKSKIYSYVIPEEIFNKFSHQVKNEILSAEIEYINSNCLTLEGSYRNDYNVSRKYLIALEKSLNDVILDTNPPSSSPFFSSGANKSLWDFYTCISNNEHSYLKEKNLNLYNYLTTNKGLFLKLNQIRNSQIHLNENEIDHKSLINIRRIVLGVGTEGLLVLLYKAAYKNLSEIYEIHAPKETLKKQA